jgi:hypothetical protein
MLKFNIIKVTFFLGFIVLTNSNCTKKDLKVNSIDTNSAKADDRPVINFTPNSKISKPQTQQSGLGNNGTSRNVGDTQLNNENLGCFYFPANNFQPEPNSYYRYPLDTINLSSLIEGTLIFVDVFAYDIWPDNRPNRFTVYDAISGDMLASSGWIGTANFPGPWGNSLNGSRGGTFTLIRSASVNYYLEIETYTDHSFSSDYYGSSPQCYEPQPAASIVFGNTNINYYNALGVLQFNSTSDFAAVTDKLRADYETYNTNYENQFPNFTAEQLDQQDSILNFNQWKTLEDFENLFIPYGFSPKRIYLRNLEKNWLNTADDLTDETDPDSLNYSNSTFENAILNQNYKVIIGKDSYWYKSDGLYINGIKAEQEEDETLRITSLNTIDAPPFPPFCTYCDTCKQWKRERAWSNVTLIEGRKWQFKKVIAIRGVSPDGRGYVTAKIKATAKYGRTWREKRAYFVLQMIGKIYSNKCTQEASINSGVYQNSIPRTRYEKLYAPAGSRFIRTKKNKITGSFQLRPKNSDAWAGELLQLSW